MIDLLKQFVNVEMLLTIVWLLVVAIATVLWANRNQARAGRAGLATGTQSAGLRRLVDLMIGLVTPTSRRIKSIGLVGVGILINFGARETLHCLGREEIRSFITSHSETIDVFEDGRPVSDVPEYVAALSSIHFVFAHHSSPTDDIAVALVARDGERIELRLAEDSYDPKEYWVFFPPYAMSKTDEIGRLNTPLFRRSERRDGP